MEKKIKQKVDYNSIVNFVIEQTKDNQVLTIKDIYFYIRENFKIIHPYHVLRKLCEEDILVRTTRFVKLKNC